MAKHAAAPGGAHGKKTKSRYVPALDGLRAFAVISVIVYHMGLGWAPGGLMGVTVFFVISGYLINGLLVAERENTGTISLKDFWLRRIRRLFPAIFLSVVGTAALCTLFNHALLDKMRPDILPSLLFYNNWWQIFRDISYFEAAGSPSPLTHFWSLSIEEQFYVVWPLLLLLMYRLGMNRQGMTRVVAVLAVLSAVEMALLYDPMGDPSRIYYGTDTRAMSLLLGVWLSFMWPSAAFGEEPTMDSRHRGTWLGFNIAGVVALAGLIVIVVATTGFSAFPYLGGIALTSVLSAVLIAVLAVPDTWVARLFALGPFVYIGKRSYGMYLWHFPILLLTTNINTTTGTPWWMRIVQIALIIVIAELSFRFVEDPIRKGKLGKWIRNRKDAVSRGGLTTPRVAIPALCFTGLLVVAGIGIIAVPHNDFAAELGQAGTQGQVQKPERPEPDENSADVDLSTYEGMFLTPRSNAKGGPIYEPLLIGDSVSLGAEGAFYEVFPYGHLDSVVSRNIWESPYEDYLSEDSVGSFVVFCLGTNNAVADWQIDDLLAPVADDKQVIMVNTRNTQDWFEATNEEIAKAPERHRNVTVVDWCGASEGHDEYFAGDGTHLTEEGAHAYVDLIQKAVESSYNAENERRAAAEEQAARAADAQWTVEWFFENLKNK